MTLQKIYSSHKYFTWIFILACFLIFYQITQFGMLGDDAIYSTRSIGLVDYMFAGDKQSTPLIWFEQYPSWAYLSYHDHPPLLFLIQHIFLSIKQSIFWAKLPYALMGLGTLLLTYLWSKKIFNKKVAALTALFLTLNTFFIWSSKVTYLEGGVCFFVILTLYLLNKFINNKKYWWPFGLALGLTLLTKYTAVFILPTILIYLLITKRYIFKQKQFYLSLLIAFIIFLPVIIYNVMMYKTTGHFDLQFSGLFRQATPWDLSQTINANYLNNFISIFKSLAAAISWPYLILSLVGLIYFAFRSHNLIPFYAWVFLTLMFSMISPAARFLPLYNIFLAIFLGFLAVDLTKKIKANLKIIYSTLIILIIAYFAFFSFNSYFLFKPPGNKLGLTHSSEVKRNQGLVRLNKYLDKLIKGKQVVNKGEQTNELKDKQSTLKKYKFNRQPLNPNQEKFYDVFVYDSDISWPAKVWLYERPLFYNNLPYYSDLDFIEINKTDEVIHEFYFIKATQNFPLESEDHRFDVAEIIEDIFLTNQIQPQKLIYRPDGEIVFKIYHYRMSDVE